MQAAAKQVASTSDHTSFSIRPAATDADSSTTASTSRIQNSDRPARNAEKTFSRFQPGFTKSRNWASITSAGPSRSGRSSGPRNTSALAPASSTTTTAVRPHDTAKTAANRPVTAGERAGSVLSTRTSAGPCRRFDSDHAASVGADASANSPTMRTP